MVHEKEEGFSDEKTDKVQNKIEYTWWKTRIWSKLLRHIFTSDHLDKSANPPFFVQHIFMVHIQIDYVLAFPQAPIQFDMYMEIPKGVEVDIENQGENKQYVLKLLKNFYGQK